MGGPHGIGLGTITLFWDNIVLFLEVRYPHRLWEGQHYRLLQQSLAQDIQSPVIEFQFQFIGLMSRRNENPGIYL